MRPDVTSIYLKEIADNTKKISDVLANKKTEQTVGQHRIGALRRISAAIKYIDDLNPYVDKDFQLGKIRNILLGTGGD